MKRACLFLVAAVLVASTSVFADDPFGEAPKADEKPVLKTVTVIDGFKGEIKDVAKLPPAAQLVARALAYKDATYTMVDGKTLKIGHQVKILRDGTVITKIEFQSDCPNNSQYHVENQIVAKEPNVQRACEQWCRFRHDAMESEILRLNTRKLVGTLRNFDVQLKLDKVALR